MKDEELDSAMFATKCFKSLKNLCSMDIQSILENVCYEYDADHEICRDHGYIVGIESAPRLYQK